MLELDAIIKKRDDIEVFFMKSFAKFKNWYSFVCRPVKVKTTVFLLIMVVFYFGNVPLSGQLPLPPFPFPDPFGIFGGTTEENQQIVNEIVTVGMERTQPGVAPYGLDAAGNPNWPVPEPDPAQSNSTTDNVSAPVPAKITDTAISGQETVENHREKIEVIPAKNKFAPTEISAIVRNDLYAGTKSSSGGTESEKLSENEIKALQVSFLYDLQRRARFIYEAKNDMAAAVSCKWQKIGRLYPDQIDKISFDIAQKNNFDNFSFWIDSVVEEDKKYADDQ
jgi:hypothetical protein